MRSNPYRLTSILISLSNQDDIQDDILDDIHDHIQDDTQENILNIGFQSRPFWKGLSGVV